MSMWIANKSAKFHAKWLNQSENIPTSFRVGYVFATPCRCDCFYNFSANYWKWILKIRLQHLITTQFCRLVVRWKQQAQLSQTGRAELCVTQNFAKSIKLRSRSTILQITYEFLPAFRSNYRLILYHFPIQCKTLVEHRDLFIPPAFDAPVRGVPSEYCHNVLYRKIRVVWLPDDEKS